jgi:hypothetical protein
VGPVGKRETRPHRVFRFSIRAVLLSFFASFFLCGKVPISSAFPQIAPFERR